MKKDFKFLDNILAFRPWREPSVPAALNAASAIQSDFYLGRKEICWAMNEKVSLDKYIKYLLNLKGQKLSKANYFVLISSENRTKNLSNYTIAIRALEFCSFFERSKNTFEIS
jgi:hypothetical protein